MHFDTQKVGRTVIAASLIFADLTGVAIAQDVHGAGSTFVAPVLTKWAEDYSKASGVKIAYDIVGSGAGIKAIEAGTVDFGATDKPLDPAELAKYGLCQFPLVVGGIVPVYNLPGIASGKLRFSGQVLADIYLNKIKSWDDPEIKQLNPTVKLPAMAIAVVHRSDSSGTTYNWTDFLAKGNADWKSRFGAALAPNWPIGAGGNGNAGVADAVIHTPGSIGYVEYSFAVQKNMSFGQVENVYHLMIMPSPDAFQSAAAGVQWKYYPDFSALMTNGGGGTSYPITATTFILMYKNPKVPARSEAALKFFDWAMTNGDKQAADLNYVALPSNLITLIQAYWATHIKGHIASRS